MLRVTCHRSLIPTATVTDPTAANTPTMHSKLIQKDQKNQKKIQMQKNHPNLAKTAPSSSFQKGATTDGHCNL